MAAAVTYTTTYTSSNFSIIESKPVWAVIHGIQLYQYEIIPKLLDQPKSS